MQHNGWDHALKATADGKGLVGHAGAILLRVGRRRGPGALVDRPRVAEALARSSTS